MKLEFDFKSRKQVDELIQRGGTNFTVFVPTTERVPVGALVSLDLSLSGSAQVFSVSGRVSQVRYSGTGTKLLPGISVVCDHEATAPLSKLTHMAGTYDFSHTRRFPRHAVSTPVFVHIEGPKGKESRQGSLADISLGGAFVTFPTELLPPNAQFSIELPPRPFSLHRPKLGARVCWTGRVAGQVGVGARFVSFTGGAREALARMVGTS